MTCHRCGGTTHHDVRDAREHCDTCNRVPAFCRCAISADRRPLWLERARERRGGLAKDLTAA